MIFTLSSLAHRPSKAGHQEDRDVEGRVAMHIWCIWQNRKDAVWNKHSVSAVHIGQQSVIAWQNWCAAKQHQPCIIQQPQAQEN
ncbi:hypothetical protein A2U01_0054183, partial [Trifolium medium]|nr:hypothetical protein [Trifolium medium]